jgi:hypothetical protein
VQFSANFTFLKIIERKDALRRFAGLYILKQLNDDLYKINAAVGFIADNK